MNGSSSYFFAGKRRIVWFVVALLVIAGGLSWQISRSREPMYEGKPLTYWLERLETHNRSLELNRRDTSWQKAEQAVEAIGTNAIPIFMSMLQSSDSSLKLRLAALLSKQALIHVDLRSAEHGRSLARDGFEVLGSSGAPAVQGLVNIYEHNTNARTRLACLESLGAIGPPAKNAVSILASSLVDTKDPNRVDTLMALQRIHSDAFSAVPALTNCLNDADIVVRIDAAYALMSYRGDARAAIPALWNLYCDENQNPDVRKAALDALWRIDRHALRQIDPKTAAQVE